MGCKIIHKIIIIAFILNAYNYLQALELKLFYVGKNGSFNNGDKIKIYFKIINNSNNEIIISKQIIPELYITAFDFNKKKYWAYDSNEIEYGASLVKDDFITLKSKDFFVKMYCCKVIIDDTFIKLEDNKNRLLLNLKKEGKAYLKAQYYNLSTWSVLGTHYGLDINKIFKGDISSDLLEFKFKFDDS